MPQTSRTDEETLARAARDAKGSLYSMVQRRLKDIKPTFDVAYDRMSNKGKPLLFLGKTAAVGVGSIVMADGIYHLVAGSDERVEDLFLHNEESRNYVRMFVGAGELAAGALIAYVGATKGPIR